MGRNKGMLSTGSCSSAASSTNLVPNFKVIQRFTLLYLFTLIAHVIFAPATTGLVVPSTGLVVPSNLP